MFIPSRVLVFLSQYLILRGNYRKSIYWQFSNYRSNYWYLFITNLSYCWLKGIIGNIIDNENLRKIIKKLLCSKNLTYCPPLTRCHLDNSFKGAKQMCIIMNLHLICSGICNSLFGISNFGFEFGILLNLTQIWEWKLVWT